MLSLTAKLAACSLRILDLGLPDRDGMTVLSFYSGQGPHDARARADVARRQTGGDRGLRLSHETV